MALLQDPAAFARARIGDGGRSLAWLDAQGDVLDFCADSLRFKAEEHLVRKRAARYAESKAAAAESGFRPGPAAVASAARPRSPGKIP